MHQLGMVDFLIELFGSVFSCAALPNREHIPPAMAFIQFKGITKRFPGVLTLYGVSFGVARGSCHGAHGRERRGQKHPLQNARWFLRRR